MTQDTTALNTIIAEQCEAWCAGDASRFCRSATDDIVFTNIVGSFLVGREGYEGQHRHIFATFYKGSRLDQRVERISFVRPDVAIVNTLATVTDLGPLPPVLSAHLQDEVLTTRMEQVFVQTGETWQVAAFHNVPVDPHAAATAPTSAS